MVRRRKGDPSDVDTGEFDPDELPEDTGARKRLETLHKHERTAAVQERRRFGDEVDHYTSRIRNVLALAGMVSLAVLTMLTSFGWRFSSPREANTQALQVLRAEAMDSLKSIRREQAAMRLDVDTIKRQVIDARSGTTEMQFMLCLIVRRTYPDIVPQLRSCRTNGSASLWLLPTDTARDATRVATAFRPYRSVHPPEAEAP
jgi:hypothetical protein